MLSQYQDLTICVAALLFFGWAWKATIYKRFTRIAKYPSLEVTRVYEPLEYWMTIVGFYGLAVFCLALLAYDHGLSLPVRVASRHAFTVPLPSGNYTVQIPTSLSCKASVFEDKHSASLSSKEPIPTE